MTWYRNLRMVAKIILPVGFLLIVALSALTWQIQSRSSAALRAVAERELAALSAQYGNYMQSFFETPLDAAHTLGSGLSQSLSKGLVSRRDAVIELLRGVQRSSPLFMAAGFAAAPNALDGKDAEFKNTPGSDADGRFLPYVVAGQEALDVLTEVNASDWYLTPQKTKEPYLANPYFYSVNGKQVLMTTASAPIFVGGTFRGVITVDVGLEDVNRVVNDLKIYKTGIAAMLTQEGIIVSCKDPLLLGKNAFNEARLPMGNKAALQQAMREGKPYVDVVSSGASQTIDYYYPINFRSNKQRWYFVVSAPLDEVLEEANAISRLTIGMSAVVLLLVLALIFIVVRASAKPIVILAATAEEIAKGKLDTPIRDETFGGEVKQLSTALKDMIATLVENIAKARQLSEDAQQQAEKARQAMQSAEVAENEAKAKSQGMLVAADRLEEVAQVVSSASAELSAQIEQSEHGAAEQAARVTETATAMEEMNSTVLEVARNAGQASEVSAATRGKAEEGAAVVKQAVASIQTVQQQSLELKKDMAALDENAQSIAQIMGVISDIADQTNLLALNAAIEAARAGEAGRGFAVVADEVRKLAEKTMTSTTDVGNAIKAIQQSTAKSIHQVEATVTTIEQATALAGQSGVALEEIVTMVDGTADQVRAIATASEQQSASSEEINQSITQVNGIAGETARAMQEAARAVSDLAQQAQALTQLIEEMKRI